MKKSLREEAAQMILNGEIAESVLKDIIKGEIAFSTKVLKSVDILADGRIVKHETTKKEVMHYVANSDDYDNLMVELEDERNRVTQRESKKALKMQQNRSEVEDK